MSVEQYSQTDLIDSTDSLADTLTNNNTSLTELQINNIGIGLYGFSIVSGTTGMLNTNIGFDRINQALKIILHTVIGEIPMLPKLGSNLDKFLFEPIDDILDDDLKLSISDAVNTFEKRIKIMDIIVDHDTKDQNKVHITVSYVLTNTNIMYDFEDTIYTSNGGVV